MKRIHGILALALLVFVTSTVAFSTDAQCAKKHKDKTAVSENSAESDTAAKDEDVSADTEQSKSSDSSEKSGKSKDKDSAKDTGTDSAKDKDDSTGADTEDTGNIENPDDEISGDTVSGNVTYTKKQKKWLDKVMVKTDRFVPVYAEAKEGAEIVGRMYSNSVAKVKKIGKKYTKVKNRAVKGYILNDDCIYGIDALEHKKELKKENSAFSLGGIYTALTEYSEEDLKLLGAIIYCEGGYEIYEGQGAVGAVVMNRMRSELFPDTIEGVIYQKYQFGPASSGLLEKTLEGDIKESCLEAAEDALYGVDPTKGAFYFRRVGYTQGIEIGNHVFF